VRRNRAGPASPARPTGRTHLFLRARRIGRVPIGLLGARILGTGRNQCSWKLCRATWTWESRFSLRADRTGRSGFSLSAYKTGRTCKTGLTWRAGRTCKTGGTWRTGRT